MSQFYTLLTDVGQAKLANAIALDQPFSIAELAVGDGGGTMPEINASATALVNEVRRAAVNRVETDADNPNWLVVEQVLPPEVGGWTIREAGVYDADGDLIAIGTYPATYKPQLAEGASRTQTIRFVMMVSDTAAITLKVDPSVVLATRGYVDDKLASQPQAETGTDNTHFSSPLRVFQGVKKFLGMTKPGAGGGLDADRVDDEHAADLHDAARLTGALPQERIDTNNYNVAGKWSFGGANVNLGYASTASPPGVNDSPSEYPPGYSIISVNASVGWPTDIGVLVTFRSTNNRNAYQEFVEATSTGGSGPGRRWYRSAHNIGGGWAPFYELLSALNTTVDSNGFIKNASPIVRLYLDRLETNHDFDATLAKQAVGHYRLDNAYGLAREGWQIEIPRDANGQIEVYAEVRELADRTVEVKTYAPVYVEGVATPGAPMDIPEGRWVDMRLQEPEPEPETPA